MAGKIILGVVVAGVVFLASGWLLGGGGAMLVASLAGYLTFSLSISGHEPERQNILNPQPTVYDKPLEDVFKAIRDTLAEQTVNWGDGWKVPTADTLTNKIVAHMRFDHEVKLSKGVQRLRRLLVLKVQLHSVDDGKTQVEFHWMPKKIEYLVVTGFDPKACDEVITDFMRELDTRIGAGVVAVGNKTPSFGIKAPDTQTLVITAIFLVLMGNNIVKINAAAYQANQSAFINRQANIRNTLEDIQQEAKRLEDAESAWKSYRKPDDETANTMREGWEKWQSWTEEADRFLKAQQKSLNRQNGL